MFATTKSPSPHFTGFRSAREEAAITACGERLTMPDAADQNSDLATEAAYYSRRAREELQRGIVGSCRRARESHFELAEAYEFRARLLTEELRRRGAAQQCYAL